MSSEPLGPRAQLSVRSISLHQIHEHVEGIQARPTKRAAHGPLASIDNDLLVFARPRHKRFLPFRPLTASFIHGGNFDHIRPIPVRLLQNAW